MTACLLALAQALLWTAATPTAGRATLARVSGPAAAQVTNGIGKALAGQGFRLVTDDEVRQSIIALRARLDDPAGLAAVANQLNLAAVLTGTVTSRRKVLTLEIAVHDLGNGSILARTAFTAASARALGNIVARTLWRRIGRTVVSEARRAGQARVAPPTPTPTPPPAPLAPPPPTRPRRPIDEEAPYAITPAPPPPPVAAAPGDGPLTTPAAFELTIGPRALYRQLSYDSDPDNALTPFRTRLPAPGLGVQAAWFPRLASPRLGLSGSLEYGAPLVTRTSADLSYQLPNSDFLGSVLVGYPWRYATVDLALGGGQHRFGVVPEGGAASRPRQIPDVSYQYLRAGLDVRVYTPTRFGVVAGAYYRHVIDAGALGSDDWFPSLRARGFEARAGLTYRFLPSLEARLEGQMRVYRLTSDPEARGGHVTAGGTDQYWSAWLAAAVLLGGAAEPR